MVKKTIKYTLILILFISVILVYTTHTYNIIEPFREKRRMAIILRGESFRLGSQDSRIVGNDQSYEEQEAASDTHNKLAEKIESLGYIVDVYIDTYSTKYDNDLLSWYGTRAKLHKFHKVPLESQEALIKDSIELMEESIDYYDAILLLRLDLFLKDQYINEYDPGVQTVQFISALWLRNSKTPKGNPRINAIIFHYPKKYYNKLHILYTGSSKKNGMRMHDILDYDTLVYNVDYTFLSNNFYDSDSQKDLNPYYRIVGRPESTVWHDAGKEFPRDF
jgi:hypothetical protein